MRQRRQRSRSLDEVEKLIGELDQSEETLSENVNGGTDATISRARNLIGKRSSLLESFRTSFRNVDVANNFTKKMRSSTSHLTSSSSIKFPIDAFTIDDSTEFGNPDLFSEVYSMTYTSASIFALAEVREAARNGKINNDELDIVSTPVATGSIVKAFERNRSFFRSQLKIADYKFLSSLARNTHVDNHVDTLEDAFSKAEDIERDRKSKALALINSLSIDYFGDDNVDSQCLYMITRSPVNNRITLIFRGSTTVQDWIKDSKLIVSDIENPVSDRPNQLPMIGVHKGFREYLYGESRSLKAEVSGNEHDETTPSHNIQQLPITTVTGNTGCDDKIEVAIEPDCSNKDDIQKEMGSDEDLSADDDNILPKNSDFCGSVTINQEDQKTTSDLLNYLGLDLSSIKEKQKHLWSSFKWNGISPLNPNTNEGVSKNKNASDLLTKFTSPDLLMKFKTPRNRPKKKSRLARILDELTDLQREYDNYRVYITGHSLGGALGLLAALEVAERLGKAGQPVTFVGIGNPRAGTEGFRDAVAVLEREGKMRCLSIHGRFDVVTMLPNAAFSAFSLGTKRRFCQSGFELILNSGSSKFYMRRSDLPDDKYLQRMGLALFRADRIAERHHYVTYLKDLEALKRPLQKLYLNDFYDKFVEQSLFPCSEKKMTPLKVRAARGRYSVAIIKQPSKKEMKRVSSADDLCHQVELSC